MADAPLPRLTRDDLVDLGGWDVLKEARGLHTSGAVLAWNWQAPRLSGKVRAGGRAMPVSLNIPTLRQAEAKCGCSMGRRGIACPHILALAMKAAEAPEGVTAWTREEETETVMQPPSPPASASRPNPSQTSRLGSTSPRSTLRVSSRKASSGPVLELDGSLHYISVQLLSRDHPAYAEAVALLRLEGFVLETSNRRWWLRDRAKTLRFLGHRLPELKTRELVRLSKGFQERTRNLREVTLQTRVEGTAEAPELVLSLGIQGLDPATLHRAVATGQPFIEVGQRVVLIPTENLALAERLQRQLKGNSRTALAPVFRQRLKPAELPAVEDLLSELPEPFVPPAFWTRRTRALRQMNELSPAPLDHALEETLRGYQRLGVAWLWHLYQNDFGGILADEMGLGKTLQALALLTAVKSEAEAARPALVLCQASLTENWRREAARFTPGLRTFVHHRENRLTSPEAAEAYDLILTTYGTLARDAELFSRIEWQIVMADEAQNLRNPKTQHAKALRSLQTHGRFGLTGTPVENRFDDLRALFAFLSPGLLRKEVETERDFLNEHHQRLAAPFILRRTKQLVAPELPEKIEQTLFIELEPAQKALYEKVRQSAENNLTRMESQGAREGALRMAALTQLLRLREVCADPRLIDPSVQALDSAKLRALDELLDQALEDGHRILLFSQFTRVLDLLESHLRERELTWTRLDGSTRHRQAMVDRFRQDTSIPIFLLSLKAGGTGLNLTAADTVVHFDPWWNPAVEAQATDRAHRIGQTRTVTSYRLITTGTVEEQVLTMAREKAEVLAGLFAESAKASRGIALADLKALLGSPQAESQAD